MTLNDHQKGELVSFAVRQAGPRGSLEEMKVICYCLRNRVRSGWHEGSWMKNLEHAEEYAGNEPGERVYIEPENRMYQMLLQAVDDIYYAQTPLNQPDRDRDAQGNDLASAVGTATYWMYVSRPLRPWFVENIVQQTKNHPQRGNIGLLFYYR